jgi:hypothetical protein
MPSSRRRRIPEPRAALGVEATGGFVQEHELRSVDQTQGDVQATPLPARVDAGGPVCACVKLERGDELGGAAPCIPRAHAIEAALEDELGASSDRVVAAALLTHVADSLPHMLWLLEQVTPGHGRFAATGRQQSRQHPECGCLPGAVGAEEAEDGSGFDTEVDSSHGFDRALPSFERTAQAARLDHAAGFHGHSPW